MAESQDSAPLAEDLLEGAAEIARFVFGRDDAKSRRRVYHLAAVDRSDRLPVFRMGSQIFARKSTLLRSIAEREAMDRR